jgi:hypothetical protein
MSKASSFLSVLLVVIVFESLHTDLQVKCTGVKYVHSSYIHAEKLVSADAQL